MITEDETNWYPNKFILVFRTLTEKGSDKQTSDNHTHPELQRRIYSSRGYDYKEKKAHSQG